MQVTVQYWAQARLALGRTTETLDVAAPPTVGEVLRQLAQRHGEPLRRLVLTDAGTPHPALLLFVGDDQVRPDAATPLRPGEVLNIMPPIAGG